MSAELKRTAVLIGRVISRISLLATILGGGAVPSLAQQNRQQVTDFATASTLLFMYVGNWTGEGDVRRELDLLHKEPSQCTMGVTRGVFSLRLWVKIYCLVGVIDTGTQPKEYKLVGWVDLLQMGVLQPGMTGIRIAERRYWVIERAGEIYDDGLRVEISYDKDTYGGRGVLQVTVDNVVLDGIDRARILSLDLRLDESRGGRPLAEFGTISFQRQ